MAVELSHCPGSPNCVCSLDVGRDSYIEPFAYSGSAAEAMARLKQVMAGLPRHHIVQADDRYVHVTFSSWLFGFVDDVEFLLDDETKQIQVRSEARSGKYDFGVNRRRIETLRSRFRE